jgi:predicted nucleic acid-binding Zn ribbon protein
MGIIFTLRRNYKDMPNYKYICPKCETTEYKVFTLNEYSMNPEVICEKCNTKMVRNLSTNRVNHILKSKGFYSTDNK